MLTAGGVVLLLLALAVAGQAFDRTDLFPFARSVFAGLVQLEQLLTRYVTRAFEFLRAGLFLLAVRTEHQRIGLVSDKHRRKVTRPLGIELLGLTHAITTRFAFPFVDLIAGVAVRLRYVILWMGLQVELITLCCILVFTLILQRQACVEEDRRILQVIFASQRTLVTTGRLGVVD